MRLSQIKISGFKSFVDTSKILFPANITGIVGPNGCGKSNVIDAVRWVMGESSAKHLRGDSMEDVIFSGSSERKPVGQAVVELIFDNTDGRVKGEYAKYSEISVKRLATRAGQSKYFLNNTGCRRRDIADIFFGTGLGPRSYSIIEQGMVSRVIDAKPEELRVYLEEAAGISKYKQRRRETETRIRHTRDNLDRLTDIIDEIEKQLSRLNRQSEVAEKFKHLKQAQRKLEAESLLLEKIGYEDSINQQNKTLLSAETSLEVRRAELRQVEKYIEENRAQLITATDQHNKVQSEYYRLGSEISTQQQSIESQRNLHQHNKQQLENIQQSLKDSQQKIDTDKHQATQLESDIAIIRPQLESSMADLEIQEQLSIQAETDIPVWQEKWDQFRQSFHKIHQAAEVENRNIAHIERQLQQLDQRRVQLQQEFKAIDTSTFDGEINSLQQQIEEKSQEHAATQEQMEVKGSELLELRDSIEQQSSQLDQKRTQIQNLRGRLSALESLQQHVLAEDSEAVRSWLSRYQINSGKRLTEILKVKNNAEKALEVVLGPFLSAYCVEPDRAIPDRLLPNQHLSIFDRQHNKAAYHYQKDWPRLIDVIDCEIDLSALLSGVYLCQDMQELSLKKPMLEVGESLVTIDGVWGGINWLLQLGEEDPRSGMLAREQEISSIRQQLDEITQNTLILKSQIDGDRQRIQHFEKQRDDEQRALNQLLQQVSDLRNQLTRRKSQLDQMHNRYQQLQKEQIEIDDLQLKCDAELRSSKQKHDQLLIQIEQMAEQESILLAQKQGFQDSLSTSRNQLKQSREQAHQKQMRLQSLKAEHQSSIANIEQIRQQIEQFYQRSKALTKAIEDGMSPIQSMEESLQTLLESRIQNEASLSQLQTTVTERDNQQRRFEGQRNKLQIQLDDNRNDLEAQRMQYQELKIRCDTIEVQLHKTGIDLIELEENLAPEANSEQLQKQLDELAARIEGLGPINLAAIDEYQQQAKRKLYLDAQNEDLTSALATLENAIKKIDKDTKDRFKETFDAVNNTMGKRFPELFGGGEARLELTEDDLLNTGVVIRARPPGKRVNNLQLLSGGEKALTAVALIFAIFELNPSPFCMLDEVDAPLDDTNVARFCAMVNEMSEQVQFIIITHNKITMELAQSLNGVTMHEPGVSRLVSVDVSAAIELTGVQLGEE